MAFSLQIFMELKNTQQEYVQISYQISPNIGRSCLLNFVQISPEKWQGRNLCSEGQYVIETIFTRLALAQQHAV
jgi:hypothetical protein